MPAAELPSNENQRLQSLRSLRILDSARDSAFDSIVEIAATIAQVPISAISLIDRDRQWFKSSVGLDVSETPRCEAFCAHAILNPTEELVVEDATQDPRFRDNPLVTGELNIRFYAGVPLCSPFDSMVLGTLCVIDHEPRKVTEDQLSVLRSLGRQTEFLIKAFLNNRKLVEISEELDQFAAAAAHDIKSPLRGIRYLADRLEEEAAEQLTDDTMQRVYKIQQRTDRLKHLLEDLLEYAKVGHENTVEEPTNLRELVSDILDDNPLSENLTFDFSSKMESVSTTKVQLARVLRNLIGNAIKHGHAEHPKVEVTAKRLNPDFIEFVVRDNGPGIAERHQGRVFNCFETLRSRDEVEGSGMGLAIVKRSLDLNDCRIQLRSEPGKGCEFTFTWPATTTSCSDLSCCNDSQAGSTAQESTAKDAESTSSQIPAIGLGIPMPTMTNTMN